MKNLTLEQQAVILKGIASQILQMNKPSLAIVEKLFKEFDFTIIHQSVYDYMDNECKELASLKDENSNDWSDRAVTNMLLACIMASSSGRNLSNLKGKNHNTNEEKIKVIKEACLNSNSIQSLLSKLEFQD